MTMPKFYRLSVNERRAALRASAIDPGVIDALTAHHEDDEIADAMIENAIGTCPMPLGVVPELRVNGRNHAIAMATEEPSVIAGLNRVSRVFNDSGGTSATMADPVTQAQIAFAIDADCAQTLAAELRARVGQWLAVADEANPGLVAAGGGALDCRFEIIDATPPQDLPETCLGAGARDLLPCAAAHDAEALIVATLSVATRDAMGANAVNAMAEALARAWNALYGNRPGYAPCMAILTNRAPGRRTRAHIVIEESAAEKYMHAPFGDIAPKIARASRFAQNNPARAATHNKGILNGIIAAALALGQDTRAISVAAVDAACASGVHKPLAQWYCACRPQTQTRALVGAIDVPLPVGVVGGARQMPHIDAAFKFDSIDSLATLSALLASIGLAQNFAALWALVTDGIQKGHLALHEKKARIGAGR